MEKELNAIATPKPSDGKKGEKRGKAYAYMLKCKDGSLYTGWTNDIEKRVAAHNAGKGGKYTRAHLPVSLVYCEEFDCKEEAQRREWEIKQLTREEKLELVKSSHILP